MDSEQGFKEFIAGMKLKLDMNQAKKEDSWVTCDIAFLEGKLREEIAEYHGKEEGMKNVSELIDIANVCMMLYHRRVDMWAKQAGQKVFGGAMER